MRAFLLLLLSTLACHAPTQYGRSFSLGAPPLVAAGAVSPAWVQDDGATHDPFNTVQALSFSSSTTSGNAVLALYYGENNDTLTVTDNKSNTYTNCVTTTNSGFTLAIATNITGGASHEVTFTLGTGNVNPGHVIVLEYSGLATFTPFDVGAERPAESLADAQLETPATAESNELVFGAAYSGSSITNGGGFTWRLLQGTVTVEDRISSTTGAQYVGFTNAEASVSLIGATFKAQ